MKRLIDAFISLFIFTVTFLSKEVIERTELVTVQDNIWKEYLLFLLVYLLVYLIVKLLQFIVKRKRNKRTKDNSKVK